MKHFQMPPGWPQLPRRKWVPPRDWRPKERWPAPPEGWHFWVDDDGQPVRGPIGRYAGVSWRFVAAVAGGVALFAAINIWALNAVGLLGGDNGTSSAADHPVPTATASATIPPSPTVPTVPTIRPTPFGQPEQDPDIHLDANSPYRQPTDQVGTQGDPRAIEEGFGADQPRPAARDTGSVPTVSPHVLRSGPTVAMVVRDRPLTPALPARLTGTKARPSSPYRRSRPERCWCTTGPRCAGWSQRTRLRTRLRTAHERD